MMARVLARLHREGPSWLAHAAIAAAFTVVADPFLGPWESWRLAVWGYAFRELDQLGRKWLAVWGWWNSSVMREWGYADDHTPASRWWQWKNTTWDWATSTNWLGSTGDVAVPALAAALVTLRWLL